MPLHLDAIVPDNRHDVIAMEILRRSSDADPLFVSKDKMIIHSAVEMKDSLSNQRIGKIVYTMKINGADKKIELIDADIVLDNDNPTELQLLDKLPGSSDANEYYDAEVVGQGGHLQLETVCRHMIDGGIEDTVQKPFLSAFPFSVSVFDDIEEINKDFGFEKKTQVANTDMKCGGLADTFMAPASLFQIGTDSDETYTFFLGKVTDIREVELADFGEPIPFLVVRVDSGMGIIPVAMSRECFDLDELEVGKILEIRADVKAEFSIM